MARSNAVLEAVMTRILTRILSVLWRIVTMPRPDFIVSPSGKCWRA